MREIVIHTTIKKDVPKKSGTVLALASDFGDDCLIHFNMRQTKDDLVSRIFILT